MTTGSRPTVSAAMIVRDEEAKLARCLRSIASIVDEIVVVDTGSRDNSVAIARDFGARVLSHPWSGNFAEARNVALDAVRCDWVLYIDADEEVVSPQHGSLGELVDPSAPACFVSLKPRQGFTRLRELRLFRADRRIRFEGAIHESIVPALSQMAGFDAALVPRVPVDIDHSGYDEPNRAKLERNLTLLRHVIGERPSRLFYWYDLAVTLDGLGQTSEAVEVAVDGLGQLAAGDTEQNIGAANLLRHILANSIMHSDPTRAREVAGEGLALLPRDYTLRLIHGKASLACGDTVTASAAARELISVTPDDLRHELLAHDRRVFGAYAHELYGHALLAQGRLGEAYEQLARSSSPEREKTGSELPYGLT